MFSVFAVASKLLQCKTQHALLYKSAAESSGSTAVKE